MFTFSDFTNHLIFQYFLAILEHGRGGWKERGEVTRGVEGWNEVKGTWGRRVCGGMESVKEGEGQREEGVEEIRGE